jgi:hypothetical protein
MKNQLACLSGAEVKVRLGLLAAAEREVLVELLWHLAEMDHRRLYTDDAGSLYAYCTRILKMSGTAAARRIVAARMMWRRPVIGDHLANGELTLSTVCAMKNVIDEDPSLLEWALGKSEDAVRRHIAAVWPTATTGAVVMKPVSEELTEIKLVVDEQFMKLLADATSAVSHKVPDADPLAILAECMRVAVKKARSGSRVVPAEVRDVVWERAEGCCEFELADGKRCSSRHRLQFHHIIADARGGAATVDNIALVCRVHNIHHAIRDFGAAHMARFVRIE